MAKELKTLDDFQKEAAVEVMTFIQEKDIDSAEMETNTEWKLLMVNKFKILKKIELKCSLKN